MADLRVPSSEDEPDQPPGTFKLIRGKLFLFSIMQRLIRYWRTAVDETGERGHVVALDPTPSSDPNEPLVNDTVNPKRGTDLM